jgi:hypothetical protein
MSRVSKSMLEDIDESLERIENIFAVFQSEDIEDDNTITPGKKITSKLRSCIERTTKLYSIVQNNGSIAITYHSPQYTDAMGRWAAEIDHLAWCIFGCDIKEDEDEENRMLKINNKLKNIRRLLQMYVPGSC